VTTYIQANIKTFHEARISKICDLTLDEILKRKNPYLFKAKDTKTADELIGSVLDAFLSSGEETMFGNFLEELSIFINGRVYGGRKAGIPGIDLDFERGKTRYLVSIKSGPAWGNSQAVSRMVQAFNSAKKTLRTSGGYRGALEFVNGCCYGVDDKPEKSQGYRKLCGQRFWTFISGSDTLYVELIVPLGHTAKEWNERIRSAYNKTRVRLVGELRIAGLVLPNGQIDWEKLVKYTSQGK
jgi:hypothetical protein